MLLLLQCTDHVHNCRLMANRASCTAYIIADLSRDLISLCRRATVRAVRAPLECKPSGGHKTIIQLSRVGCDTPSGKTFSLGLFGFL